MKGIHNKWVYLAVLSLIWGSSFILIKKSLLGLSPLQLGALRILFAAAFLLIIAHQKLKTIAWQDWKWILVSAFVGTFFPAFLFAYAETEIDSAIASILNATTPIMTLVLGISMFSSYFSRNQLLGVFIGLFGSLLLIWAGSDLNPQQNYWYAGLALIAALCYAFNVNIIKTYLQHLPALSITVGNFSMLLVPAAITLFMSGFFTSATLSSPQLLGSLGYLLILGVVGTGVALILFNQLIKMSAPVFASSVTYTMPIVAVFWGVLDGEFFNWIQLGAAIIILLGVLLSNKS